MSFDASKKSGAFTRYLEDAATAGSGADCAAASRSSVASRDVFVEKLNSRSEKKGNKIAGHAGGQDGDRGRLPE